MKKEISPITAIVVIVIVLAIIGGVYFWKTSSRPAAEANQPPPLPPEVGKTLSEIMSKAGTQQGQSAPTGSQTGGPPPAPNVGGSNSR